MEPSNSGKEILRKKRIFKNANFSNTFMVDIFGDFTFRWGVGGGGGHYGLTGRPIKNAKAIKYSGQ